MFLIMYNMFLLSSISLILFFVSDYLLNQLLFLTNISKIQTHSISLINIYDICAELKQQIINRNISNIFLINFITPFIIVFCCSEITIKVLNFIIYFMIFNKLSIIFDNYNVLSFNVKTLYLIPFVWLNFGFHNIIFIFLYFIDVKLIILS